MPPPSLPLPSLSWLLLLPYHYTLYILHPLLLSCPDAGNLPPQNRLLSPHCLLSPCHHFVNDPQAKTYASLPTSCCLAAFCCLAASCCLRCLLLPCCLSLPWGLLLPCQPSLPCRLLSSSCLLLPSHLCLMVCCYLLTRPSLILFYDWLSIVAPCRLLLPCCKPPRYVPYKCTYVPYDGTFGMSDQGQMLDVWQSEDSQIHHLIRQIRRFTISSVRKKLNQKRYRRIRISMMILDHMDRNQRYFPSKANLVGRSLVQDKDSFWPWQCANSYFLALLALRYAQLLACRIIDHFQMES